MGTQYKTDFQTPPEVAEYMASLIPEDAMNILEPTPGIGNIVNAIILKRGGGKHSCPGRFLPFERIKI
jgi:hypothetical protein